MSSSEPYQPGSVRRDPTGKTPEVPAVDLARHVDTLFRVICLSVLVVVLCIGVYYSLDVFMRIGKLLAQPSQAQTTVDEIARLAHADNLKINVPQGQTLEFGHLVSLLVLGIGYLAWAWIPIQIIAVVGRIILTMTSKK